jgi:copper chaperone CopZ
MLTTYQVENIKCSGCANRVKTALKDVFGNVNINLEVMPREVTVNINNNEEKFKDILQNLGYYVIGDEYSSMQKAKMKAKSFVSCAIGKVSENKEN